MIRNGNDGETDESTNHRHHRGALDASPSCAAFHHRHWGLYFRIDHGRQKAMQIASMNKNANYETNPTSILFSTNDMNGVEKIG
jgi:hypothetical protein